MFQILICEDDLNLRQLMKTYLEKQAYTCHVTTNGEEALDVLEKKHIDLLITDIMMPVMDGHQLTINVKKMYPKLPLIMYSALDTIREKQKGYEAGIDDYIVKPIDFKELVFKVSALLKRAEAVSRQLLSFPNSKLDFTSKTYTENGEIVKLTLKEFELLFYVLSKPDVIHTRETLMAHIWGYDSESYDRTIDTHIKRLREKTNTHDFEIITVRGLGYKGVIQ